MMSLHFPGLWDNAYAAHLDVWYRVSWELTQYSAFCHLCCNVLGDDFGVVFGRLVVADEHVWAV